MLAGVANSRGILFHVGGGNQCEGNGLNEQAEEGLQQFAIDECDVMR